MFQILLQVFQNQILRNPPQGLRVLMLMAAILLYGTTGFLYFELSVNPDLSWLDALWYTVVTLTTVGYGDFFPKTAGGRLFVGVPIMVFGIGLLGYALSLIAAALVTSKTKEIKGMATFSLKNHLVIFNFSSLAKLQRVLEEVSQDPAVGRIPVVVVDEALEELPAELQNQGIHYVRGNPTRDETLQRAAIDQARHAVILSRNPADPASDHLNLAITLAIEARNRKVNTVVECVDAESEELLHKAGCDRIICNSRFDAHFISQELLNPGIQEVLDELLTVTRGQQFYLIPVAQPGSFEELSSRCHAQGHIALGFRDQNQQFLNPTGTTPVAAGALLVTLGPQRLEQI